MLKAKLIRKIFDNFEIKGFNHGDYKGRLSIEVPNDNCVSKNIYLDTEIFRLVYYPLFLQRVIEGINKESNIMIDQTKGYVSVQIFDLKEKTQEVDGYDLSVFTPDQAKEQAIKYILKKI